MYPRQESNLRFCLRRATLYPLSYEGVLVISIANIRPKCNPTACASCPVRYD
jgi:hypothetical protein